MTAPKKLWPRLANDLAELNERAREVLAIGPQMDPSKAKPFPWPTWAPAPGAWVREAHEGRKDRLHGPTWHILASNMLEDEAGTYTLFPLCGRRIRVEPDGLTESLRASGRRCAKLDVRVDPTPHDKECWHCQRKLGLIGGEVPAGQVRRPWGDLGAAAYYSRTR